MTAFSYKPAPYEGIVAGEIIGWRSWLFHGRTMDGEQCLESIVFAVNWLPGKPMTTMAQCDLEGLGGVHAWKDRERAEIYANSPMCIGFDVPVILGRVKMWGEVIEHELGYRAEYAKPYSFEEVINLNPYSTPAGGSLLLAHLRKQYGLKGA